MSQLSIEVEEFRQGANWRELEVAVDHHSSHSHLSGDDRSALGRMAGQKVCRRLIYSNPADAPSLKELVYKHGFRVKGEIPPGFVEIHLESIKGKPQDRKNLENTLMRSGRYRVVVVGDVVTVDQQDLDKVLPVITQCGFQHKDRRTAPEALGWR